MSTANDEVGIRAEPEVDCPMEMLAKIEALEQGGDPDALDAARREYLEDEPQGAEATRIRYQLGLSVMFRHGNADEAMALFKEAAADKKQDIAKEARISYALLLNGKKKRQQAIFELRKLTGDNVEPSIHSANALDFLFLLLKESGASADDVLKCERQRHQHLEALVDGADDKIEKAQWLLRLGASQVDSGEPGMVRRARATFSQIVKLGRAAGDSAVKSARQELRLLPR